MTREARDIVVCTGDIRRDYEIVGPVYFHLSNRGMFGSQFSRLEKDYREAIERWSRSGQATGVQPQFSDVVLTFLGEWGASFSAFDKAFFIAVEELRKRAARLGADGIVFVRQDIDLDTTGFQYFYLQIYGTAVRFT